MEKPKILIIDDERDICESLKYVLSAKGYIVDVAYTAGEGVEKIKKVFFNLVLLDMRLPDYDGIKALEKIKEISPDTEVIILTAFADIKSVIEAMDKEAFSYISKPFEIPQLIAVLKKAYEKQRILFENRKLFQQVCDAKKDWEDTFDSISDLLSIHDENFNITRYNKAFARKFNAKLDELIGAKCYEIIYGIKEPCHICPYLRHNKDLKPETEEIDCQHMGGIFQITCFPRYNKEGKLDGIVHIAKDISRQKRIEEKLRFSYKMASLGRLTAGVCHEVFNPLNIISTHVQLLLMNTGKGSKIEKDLNSIQEEVDRIVKITDGLLRFSSKGKLTTKKVKINNLIEKVISIVEPDMKLRKIKFIKIFNEKLPTIKSNGDELRQVFLNMITNARDAMLEGGSLTISTQNIMKHGNPFVEIKFIDTGSGITKEIQDSVFDPFFTTKEEGKGTGLGLSESYGIIDHFGGTMSVESDEGKGSTFIVDLPVKR